jgi:predicted nucleotidyltransferase component of viral defense system
MILHKNKKLFIEAIRYTAQQKGVKEIYIEKDYWMCLILKILFENADLKIGFKGGTSLSKCYSYIERFSEDIDLCLLMNGQESSNQLNKRLKEITLAVSSHLEEVDIEGITQKIGMRRKLAYEYPKSFIGDFGQVREQMIIEATYFGVFEPYEEKEIQPYITEMLTGRDQLSVIEEFQLEPFKVLVLSPQKTLCEKIMSLVRFSYGENPVDDLKNKIRHIYDIYKLLEDKEIDDFFSSKDFDGMLKKTAKEDFESFKNNNAWVSSHPKDSLIFNDKNIWNELSASYRDSFSTLVYGDLPKEEEMIKVLKKVAERLKEITWNIDIS